MVELWNLVFLIQKCTSMLRPCLTFLLCPSSLMLNQRVVSVLDFHSTLICLSHIYFLAMLITQILMPFMKIYHLSCCRKSEILEMHPFLFRYHPGELSIQEISFSVFHCCRSWCFSCSWWRYREIIMLADRNRERCLVVCGAGRVGRNPYS